MFARGAGCAGQGNRLFPLALGAQGTARSAATSSTNAGGVDVLRYGMARALVLGLEVVLPDGRIWDGLRALRKDNTGYDLKHLFIGAEGTLGIITAAVLSLLAAAAGAADRLARRPRPGPPWRCSRSCATRFGETISAFELLAGGCLDLVVSYCRVRAIRCDQRSTLVPAGRALLDSTRRGWRRGWRSAGSSTPSSTAC